MDISGNVYVADTASNRIQKFTSDGKLIAKWGGSISEEGQGDGQFNWPSGIAVDDNGNVYVADMDNNRIQKFTSNGKFITKFGVSGNNLGQFSGPSGVSISKNGDVYITDTGNHRIQVFTPEASTPTAPNKAVIVAGSGPDVRPRLWDEISLNANYAYRVLNYQGFAKNAIYYLSYDTELDLDSNGLADDVKGKPTNSNLKKALTEWAPGAKDVVVYMMGHGGSEKFRIGETETLSASELGQWLDTLQGKISGKLTVVYEACESGSFLPYLKSASGKNRIVVTSTSSGQYANFLSSGEISFSYPFWNGVFNGENVYDGYIAGKAGIDSEHWQQTPLLDDNGNGVGSEATDGTVAKTHTIGLGLKHAAELPTIGTVSAS
ncbi:NHL repeat containing protein [Candidatus Magnetobacterium bavaricum]|uniref:NHL repeat containing protein n=1 Tax=Candidatus Magnetobacterium bavaricum TaxID=29290 RepID=A0A0F3GHX9_9BACT|nr:NHL repeat containing protein [Candidatus Magnetobacterium bavaricum]